MLADWSILLASILLWPITVNNVVLRPLFTLITATLLVLESEKTSKVRNSKYCNVLKCFSAVILFDVFFLLAFFEMIEIVRSIFKEIRRFHSCLKHNCVYVNVNKIVYFLFSDRSTVWKIENERACVANFVFRFCNTPGWLKLETFHTPYTSFIGLLLFFSNGIH